MARLLLVVLSLSACSDLGERLGLPGEAPASRGSLVSVTEVIDGDTIHVRRGTGDETIRLIGIDTPEVPWYGGPGECFGPDAGTFLQELLAGARVRLEFDRERTDPYGRTLAYVYLREQMVNLLLVRRGFAVVTIYPPNDRYREQLLDAERRARSAGEGLWSACP